MGWCNCDADARVASHPILRSPSPASPSDQLASKHILYGVHGTEKRMAKGLAFPRFVPAHAHAANLCRVLDCDWLTRGLALWPLVAARRAALSRNTSVRQNVTGFAPDGDWGPAGFSADERQYLFP